MFALNETARLHAFLGQRGGKPAYAEQGVEFRCRSEPAQAHSFNGIAIDRTADTRIFAQSVDAHPCDRVALNGESYLISEVRSMRGFRGVHHLEILAKKER